MTKKKKEEEISNGEKFKNLLTLTISYNVPITNKDLKKKKDKTSSTKKKDK